MSAICGGIRIRARHWESDELRNWIGDWLMPNLPQAVEQTGLTSRVIASEIGVDSRQVRFWLAGKRRVPENHADAVYELFSRHGYRFPYYPDVVVPDVVEEYFDRGFPMDDYFRDLDAELGG